MSDLTRSETPVRVGVDPRAWAAVSARELRDAELVRVQDDAELSLLETLDFLILAAAPSPVIEKLPQLTRLKVLQTLSAGTDLVEPHAPPHAALCSARGARDIAVAEWIFGALLGATTHLIERARVHQWRRNLHLEDLSEARVLVIGMGSIGRELQRLMAPLGTDLVGIASRARGDLRGIDELPELLPGADAIVLLAPLTDQTRGLIDAEAMALMRDGTLIVNAARGAVIDTDALVAETSSGRLHAILDVTDPEPLPDGHPLWSAPGVLSITPHIAGDSPRAGRQAAELAADQLQNWLAGRPLVNVVREGDNSA